MPYAIYRLNTSDPKTLGLDVTSPVDVIGLDIRGTVDGRFHSFGKEPHEVQKDLFAFLSKIRQEVEERRQLDDLELMYRDEMQLLPGFPAQLFQNELIGMEQIMMDHEHDILESAFRDVKLEIACVLGAAFEPLLDEALQIMEDKNVTRALALVGNPYALVSDLMGRLESVRRAAVRCVSMSGMASPEDSLEGLTAAINNYNTLYASMRWVTLAKDNKEAN